MEVSKLNLRVYRSLYWANQALLEAVRALGEAELANPQRFPPQIEAFLNDKLRRAQAMIEETRLVMNRNLEEWIEPWGR